MQGKYHSSNVVDIDARDRYGKSRLFITRMSSSDHLRERPFSSVCHCPTTHMPYKLLFSLTILQTYFKIIQLVCRTMHLVGRAKVS